MKSKIENFKKSENLENPDLLLLSSRQSHITSPESLSLTLFQKEHRKERIRLENLSPNLSVYNFIIYFVILFIY